MLFLNDNESQLITLLNILSPHKAKINPSSSISRVLLTLPSLACIVWNLGSSGTIWFGIPSALEGIIGVPYSEHMSYDVAREVYVCKMFS